MVSGKTLADLAFMLKTSRPGFWLTSVWFYLLPVGKVFVIESARQYKLITENEIGERTLASPAVVDGAVYLRSDDHVWAIGSR